MHLACDMVSAEFAIVPRKGNSMVKSIEKVLTFFIVIILSLVLLNLLGPFIASSIQPASEGVGNILHSAWIGVQHIVHTGSGTYGATG
jgi:hypothetical protein